MSTENNVVQKILSRCKDALLGGIPILYIKTDSDILIRQLVESKENPLVFPICGTEAGMQFAHRPLSEREAAGMNTYNVVFNIKYSKPKNCADLLCPHLWAFKMPPKEHSADTIALLEEYVIHHQNPEYPSYDMLRSSVVIVYSSEVVISQALRAYTEFIDVEYPDEEEIRRIILETSDYDPVLMGNEEQLNELCARFLGFSSEEVAMTMQRIMALTPLDEADKVERLVLQRKKQKMEGGALELVSAEGSIGGMIGFRRWLEKQVEPLKKAGTYKRRTGTLPPKGVLLCGIPGCGKSEAAKFTAKTLNLPLLKMDVGSLMDKYQGESELKMRNALQLAEAMSPCVLWIDELEKGFSGAGGSAEDSSGSFKRMFGYMLGWMQDNQKPCFIFATANNIGGLPKEFFRSGRFDSLYAVYLPTAKECASIFITSMKRAVRTMAKATDMREDEIEFFNSGCFSEDIYIKFLGECMVIKGKPRILIGSDIQKIVNMTLRSLADKDKVSASQWLEALRETVSSGDCAVYGDGQENVDSIAVSYCRMLRKNFVPTADEVLFSSEDYNAANLTEYSRLKSMSTRGMSDEELVAHNKNLEENRILRQQKSKVFTNAYDEAVYNTLLNRINDMAVLVERRETELLIH